MKSFIFSKELLNIAKEFGAQIPRLKAQKAEILGKLRTERQCTATTKKSARCRNWSAYGDDSNKCKRHGGKATEPAACSCSAYSFPHRRRSGFCNFPNEPLGKCKTPQGQRRYYKRQKKQRVKNWLKENGF